jgi:hypothetical protein
MPERNVGLGHGHKPAHAKGWKPVPIPFGNWREVKHKRRSRAASHEYTEPQPKLQWFKIVWLVIEEVVSNVRHSYNRKKQPAPEQERLSFLLIP